MDSMIKDRKNMTSEGSSALKGVTSNADETKSVVRKNNASFSSEQVQRSSENPTLQRTDRSQQQNEPTITTGHRQRVYSAPETSSGSYSLSGAASTASYVATAQDVIKDTTKHSSKDHIKASFESHLKGSLIKQSIHKTGKPVAVSETEKAAVRNQAAKNKQTPNGTPIGQFKPSSEAKAYLEKIQNRQNGKKNLPHEIGSRMYDSTVTATSNSGRSGDLGERTKGQGIKHLVRTPRYTKNAAGVLVVGTAKNLRFASKLAKDMKVGAITGKEAGLLVLKRGGLTLKGSMKVARKSIKKEVEDFHGSDDIGIEAIRKPKDLIVGTSKSLKATTRAMKALTNAPKNIQKGVRNAQRFAKGAAQTVKYTTAVVKTAAKALTNPVVLKSIAVIAAVLLGAAVLFSAISSIAALVSSLTLASEDVELTKTYVWVTELDTDINYEIAQVPEKTENSGVDEFHYYMNGSAVSAENMVAYTNADQVLNYLDVKYSDYTLDGVLLLFGVKVRDEVGPVKFSV